MSFTLQRAAGSLKQRTQDKIFLISVFTPHLKDLATNSHDNHKARGKIFNNSALAEEKQTDLDSYGKIMY